jgi:hypothetical protein
MKLIKRCNDPIIAPLIILPTFDVSFAFQTINCVVSPSTPVPKENQTYLAFTKSPSTLKGEATFIDADKKS